MMVTVSIGRRLFSQLPPRRSRPPKPFDANIPRPILDISQKIEEETLPWYKLSQFYPVQIGETLGEKYQVIGKLGFGAYSTVWLCKDAKSNRYVTIKISRLNSSQASRERDNYQRIKDASHLHDGARIIRSLLDDFQIQTSAGNHICLVHEPLGIRLLDLQRAFPSKKLPKAILKPLLIRILFALEFLHTKAGLIHTDIQAKNVLLEINSDKLLPAFEKAEREDPVPVKIEGDRRVYVSREFSVKCCTGPPRLCDFGEARMADKYQDELIQPRPYRAPEVVFGMPWSTKVDIWNVGVMAWHLAQGNFLFNARDENNKDSVEHHIAEMCTLLGDPTSQFLQESCVAREFFDENGNWVRPTKVPDISLDDLKVEFEDEDRRLFIECLKKMLRWLPDERPSANELLSDPWLKED